MIHLIQSLTSVSLISCQSFENNLSVAEFLLLLSSTESYFSASLQNSGVSQLLTGEFF